jgi:hypothetical protein
MDPRIPGFQDYKDSWLPRIPGFLAGRLQWEPFKKSINGGGFNCGEMVRGS